jgi:hypothetical protein
MTDLRRTIVALIGLLWREYERLKSDEMIRSLEIELRYGGCIDDGSNQQRLALKADRGADITILKTGSSRYIQKSDLTAPSKVTLRGVSSVKRWLLDNLRPPSQAA